MEITRFQVVLVALDPTVGREVQKTRPCLVISPDELNRHLSTLIVAPMTSKTRPYPIRVACRFQGVRGQVVLDQIRTIDRNRVVKVLGFIETPIQQEILGILNELFAP